MPARAEEIHHAEEEGIQFNLLSNPVEIFGDEFGRVNKIKCQKYELGEPDSSGRARPVPIEGAYFDLAVDLVVIAIGNKANPLITMTTPDLEVNKWGNIVTDEMGRTSKPFVYAGGDIVTGAATVISAMGAGRRAATAIHEDLFPKVEEPPIKFALPREKIAITDAAIYPSSTMLYLKLTNVTNTELSQVRVHISHVHGFFEETLLKDTVASWKPEEELSFECPRFHGEEKEYLLTLNDVSGKLLSKVLSYSKLMQQE
jgi:hypothetical protein